MNFRYVGLTGLIVMLVNYSQFAKCQDVIFTEITNGTYEIHSFENGVRFIKSSVNINLNDREYSLYEIVKYKRKNITGTDTLPIKNFKGITFLDASNKLTYIDNHNYIQFDSQGKLLQLVKLKNLIITDKSIIFETKASFNESGVNVVGLNYRNEEIIGLNAVSVHLENQQLKVIDQGGEISYYGSNLKRLFTIDKAESAQLLLDNYFVYPEKNQLNVFNKHGELIKSLTGVESVDVIDSIYVVSFQNSSEKELYSNKFILINKGSILHDSGMHKNIFLSCSGYKDTLLQYDTESGAIINKFKYNHIFQSDYYVYLYDSTGRKIKVVRKDGTSDYDINGISEASEIGSDWIYYKFHQYYYLVNKRDNYTISNNIASFKIFGLIDSTGYELLLLNHDWYYYNKVAREFKIPFNEINVFYPTDKTEEFRYFSLNKLSVPGEGHEVNFVLEDSNNNHVKRYGRKFIFAEDHPNGYLFFNLRNLRMNGKIANRDLKISASVFFQNSMIPEFKNRIFNLEMNNDSVITNQYVINCDNVKLLSYSKNLEYVCYGIKIGITGLSSSAGTHHYFESEFILVTKGLSDTIILLKENTFGNMAFFSGDEKYLAVLGEKKAGIFEMSTKKENYLSSDYAWDFNKSFWSADNQNLVLFINSDSVLSMNRETGNTEMRLTNHRYYDENFTNIFEKSENEFESVSNIDEYAFYLARADADKIKDAVKYAEMNLYKYSLYEGKIIDTIKLKAEFFRPYSYNRVPIRWSILDYDPDNELLIMSDARNIKKKRYQSYWDFYRTSGENNCAMYNLKSGYFKFYAQFDFGREYFFSVDTSVIYYNYAESDYFASSGYAFCGTLNYDTYVFSSKNEGRENLPYLLGYKDHSVYYEQNYTSFTGSEGLKYYEFDLATLSLNYLGENLSDELVEEMSIEEPITGLLLKSPVDSYDYSEIINTNTGDTLRLFIYTSLDWFITDNDENYFCSPGFENELLLKERKGDKTNFISSEKYYHPEIILRKLGLYGEQICRKTEILVEKAINKKMKNDSNINLIKEVKFKNYHDNFGQYCAHFEVYCDKYDSTSAQLFIVDNNVSLNILEYKKLEVHGDSLIFKIKVPIIDEMNNLQFLLKDKGGDVLGEASFNYEPEIYYEPNLYFIGLGTGNYKSEKYNLTYVYDDINGVWEEMKKGWSVNKARKLILLDDEITHQSLERIKSFILYAHPQDQIVFYIAGHGVLDNDMNFYYAPSSIDFTHPEKNGIKLEEILSLMDSTQSIKRLVFFDVCHSGTIDEEYLEDEIVQTRTGNVVFRSVDESDESRRNFLIHKIYQEMFGRFAGVNGATVISASTGTESALESSKWKHGLFSYCLIKALREKEITNANDDFYISLTEIMNRIKGEVGVYSHGLQHPEYYSVNKLVKYKF